jgi:two-component system sensor histidine kinase KdpD
MREAIRRAACGRLKNFLGGTGGAGTSHPKFQAARPKRSEGIDVVEGTDAKKPRWRRYLPGVLITAVCTVVAAIMSVWFAATNLAMVYLLGVVLAATRFGRDASVVAAVLGVLAFDFFFIPPLYSFAISDTQYLLAAIVLLTVGLVISSLAAGLRRQTLIAIHRERRTAALYAMTRELAVASSLDEIASSAALHLAHVFDAEGAILLKSSDGTMRRAGAQGDANSLAFTDPSIADWVFTQNKMAGFGTSTLSAANAMYLPLSGTRGIVGVLVVRFQNRPGLVIPEQPHLLEAFANQIAVAVERDQLGRQARDSAFAAQEERLRNSLLSSISHDLRTPLAVMGASASSLLQGETQLPAGAQRKIVETINDEAQRMSRVVNNILDMTRLESGPVQLDLQWYPLEEIVGAVLGRLKGQLGQRSVKIDIPRDLPMLHVDGALFEKVLINLLENVAKYTPLDARVTVCASLQGGNVLMQVIDDGPGIPKGSERQLFDKFYRGQAEGAISGTGLGLSICRAIIEAHRGRIWAESPRDGGVIFSIVLPLIAAPDEHSVQPI